MPGSLPHHLAYLAHLIATAAGVLLILRLTARGPLPNWGATLMGAGLAALALAAFRASDPPRPFSDFWIAYYPAGQAVLHDPARLHALTAKGVDGFVNMPVVAWLFAPFGALPPAPAAILFTALGVALSAGAWVLLCRLARLGPTQRWLLALLFVANGPLQYSLKEGNTSHMVLFALAAALVLLRADRNFAAGALLGVVAILKPPLVLFAPFLVLRRDLAGALGFAAAGAAVALTSLALFGWAENLRWFELCVVQFGHHWLAAFNVQSIPAFILRLGSGAGHLHDWSALPAVGYGERLAGQLLTGLLFVVALAACLRRPAAGDDAPQSGVRRDLQFLLVVCLSLVSSPLSWSHYYAWLLMPAAFFLGADWFGKGRAAQGLGWMAIFLITPLVWPLSFSNPLAAAAYSEVGVSHLLFGGLLMFGLVAGRLAATGGLFRIAAGFGRSSTTSRAPNDVVEPRGAGTLPS